VIDQSHPGNFEVTDRRHIRDDRPDIVGDDAAVVRLRQVDRVSGRQILDHLAGRAASQGRCKRHQICTHSKSTQMPFVRGHSPNFLPIAPTASCRPPETRERHLFSCMTIASYPAKRAVGINHMVPECGD